MELAFAGLHQLCAPMLDRLERLPVVQRDALQAAFGLTHDDPPDRFLVGLAVLSLLADAAEQSPLVCLVDDAQWLDRVSAQTLAFVARRLLAERVALVFAVREPSEDDELVGLPELRGDRTRPTATRARCSTSAITGRLDERVHDRIIAETRGNPLALLELPRDLTAAELAGGFALPDAQPLAGRIEQSFVRRLERASGGDATAAARGRRRADRRRAACCGAQPTRLGIGADAAAPAEIGGSDRVRRPGALSAPARALGGVPGSDQHRPTRGPSSAGRGDRPGHRSRPPGVAPRACRRGPRRGRGRRARALRRPGAGARRRRGRGRVPGAGGRVDARPGPPRARGRWPQRRPSSMRARPTRRSRCSTTAELGPLDDASAGAAGAAAGADRVRPHGGAATPPPLLLAAARRLEPLDAALARETYLEALAGGDLRRSPRRRRRRAGRRPRPRATAPPAPLRRARSTCCWMAWRRGSPTDTRAASRRCGERCRRFAATAQPTATPTCAGCGWPAVARSRSHRAVGRRRVGRAGHPRGRAGSRRGRAERAPDRAARTAPACTSTPASSPPRLR